MLLEYRIWNKENKEMVYNPSIISAIKNLDGMITGYVVDYHGKQMNVDLNDFMVAPQLGDYDGNEIYEGDILYDRETNYCYGIVYYDNDGSFMIGNDEGDWHLTDICFDCKIRGNKYETIL